jgi:peptide/nickel transport system permease protein
MTAYAKGLSVVDVMVRHAFRNAIIPIVTLFGMLLPAMISGSVIVEQIFSIPGMGRLGFESVLARDYPVIMGITTMSAFLTLAGLLLSDILYTLVDPRITFEAGK